MKSHNLFLYIPLVKNIISIIGSDYINIEKASYIENKTNIYFFNNYEISSMSHEQNDQGVYRVVQTSDCLDC